VFTFQKKKLFSFLEIVTFFFIVFFLYSFPAAVFGETKNTSSLAKKNIIAIDTIDRQEIRTMRIASTPFSENDTDNDGLSDNLEIALGTDPQKNDTDGDVYDDATEFFHGYDPLRENSVKLPLNDQQQEKKRGWLLLEKTSNGVMAWYIHQQTGLAYFLGKFTNLADTLKKFQLRYTPSVNIKDSTVAAKSIEVHLAKQKLSFYLDDIHLGDMTVSTGSDRGPTPIGTFKILNKSPRAWSKRAGLWMPNWMAFAQGGKYGIHELPEWPNGKKEGVNHLGKRVSHGCIRLGISDAKFLYAWTPIGTEVIVKKS